MDKERKALLTKELNKAEGELLNVVRNSNAFIRVQTLYATLDKGKPDVHIGIDQSVGLCEDIADLHLEIKALEKELRVTKSMLTKATRLATTKPETTKPTKAKSKKKTTKKK